MAPSAANTRIQRLISVLRSRRDELVIDADTHATDPVRYPPKGPEYYHGRPLSAEDLIREMDAASVSMANIWQNPAATKYPGGEDENSESLLDGNRYIFETAAQFPDRFAGSGWTDPRACGVANACRIAEICVREFGFVLVKLNPAQNQYPIDSRSVLAVVDRIVELVAIPVFHYGADTPYTPASGLEAVARRHPEHPMIAVHMGGGGAGYVEAESLYQESLLLGLRAPNLRFVFSATRDTYIEEALIRYQLAGPPFCHNLFCGSDAPYGRMSWNFGGFRAMFAGLLNGAAHPDARVRAHPGLFTPESVQNYLGRNFANLIIEGYERLAAHSPQRQ